MLLSVLVQGGGIPVYRLCPTSAASKLSGNHVICGSEDVNFACAESLINPLTVDNANSCNSLSFTMSLTHASQGSQSTGQSFYAFR